MCQPGLAQRSAEIHGSSSEPDTGGSFPTERELFLVPQTSPVRRPSTERGGYSHVFRLLANLLSGSVRVEVPRTQGVTLL